VSSIINIAPADLERRRQSGEAVDLIDVRTPPEFRELHATGAENIPLDELRGGTLHQLVARAAERPMFVICQSGGRSAKASALLSEAGAPNIHNVAGGTQAWSQVGLPVVRGQVTMSLERQVRIAAGSLVLLGIALAYGVHPWFLGLSAFVGAGLVFAGLTNTCGMGMLLAKMPWNR